MSHYAGLDVSMKETVICIVNEKGESVYRGRAKTDPEKILEHFLKMNLKIEKVGIESGSLSHWLVGKLQGKGLPAVLTQEKWRLFYQYKSIKQMITMQKQLLKL